MLLQDVLAITRKVGLAYPMPVKVTTQVLLGWKSHGCPAAYAVAVGETWVANKPGGLNVRNSDDLEIHPA